MKPSTTALKALLCFSLFVAILGLLYNAIRVPRATNPLISLPARILEVLASLHGGYLWSGIILAALFMAWLISLAHRHGYNKAKAEQSTYFDW